MKEQKKKKDNQKSNDVAMVNRKLKEIIRNISNNVERLKYEKEANQAGSRLMQCSIWEVNYQNNMENINVALSQGLFISFLLKREEVEQKIYLQNEVDILMRQIGNVDWGIYMEYVQLKGEIVK